MRGSKKQEALAHRATAALESAHFAKERFICAAASFSLTELDVAITFCKSCRVALASSSDPAQVDQKVEHIEMALRAALRTQEQIKLNAHQRKQFRVKLQQLEALVTLLAERVPSSRIEGIENCVGRLTSL